MQPPKESPEHAKDWLLTAPASIQALLQGVSRLFGLSTVAASVPADHLLSHLQGAESSRVFQENGVLCVAWITGGSLWHAAFPQEALLQYREQLHSVATVDPGLFSDQPFESAVDATTGEAHGDVEHLLGE